MTEAIRVQFETTREKLPTILQLLAGEVSNIATKSMAEILAARVARGTPAVQAPSPAPAPVPKTVRVKAGVAQTILDGIAAMGAKVGDKISYSQIEDILEKAHYARTSYSPGVGILEAQGVLKRLGKKTVLVIALTVPR